MAPETAIPIVDLAFQALLDYQMPTGEWGSADVSAPLRYARVNRPDKIKPEYLSLFRKPNVYRTLTGLEVLDYLGLRRKYRGRFDLATDWFFRNLAQGRFQEWDTVGPGQFPDRPDLPAINLTPDTRHTAQALAGIVKFTTIRNEQVVQGLQLLATEQQADGTWRRRPDVPGSEVLRNACCMDTLMCTRARGEPDRLRRAGISQDFQERVDIALTRSVAWLRSTQLECEGLFIDEYQTAMVLERIGARLRQSRNTKPIVDQAVRALLERCSDAGWFNSSIRSPSIRQREIYRYEVTVRILAALAQNGALLPTAPRLLTAVEFVQQYFRVGKIDSSDYRYFIYIYNALGQNLSAPAAQNARNYLSSAPIRRDNNAEQLIANLMIWTISNLNRLQILLDGWSLGLPQYDDASRDCAVELVKLGQVWGRLQIPEAKRITVMVSRLTEIVMAEETSEEGVRMEGAVDEIIYLMEELAGDAQVQTREVEVAHERAHDIATATSIELLEYAETQMRSRERVLGRYAGEVIKGKYAEFERERATLSELVAELGKPASRSQTNLDRIIHQINEIGMRLKGDVWRPIAGG